MSSFQAETIESIQHGLGCGVKLGTVDMNRLLGTSFEWSRQQETLELELCSEIKFFLCS